MRKRVRPRKVWPKTAILDGQVVRIIGTPDIAGRLLIRDRYGYTKRVSTRDLKPDPNAEF